MPQLFFKIGYLFKKWQTDYLNNKEITQILLFLGTAVLFSASIISGEGLTNAVFASNILTLESEFALILAFIFYRELPDLKEMFGGVRIVGSVI